jgi:hypothetical protein
VGSIISMSCKRKDAFVEAIQLHDKKKKMCTIVSRIARADALVAQAQLKYRQINACNTLASALHSPEEARAEKVINVLQEDDQREVPLIDLSFELESGDLLLTKFILFMGSFSIEADLEDDQLAKQGLEWARLSNVRPLINKLLCRPPAVHLRSHADEQNALALFAGLCVPTVKDDAFIMSLTDSILLRGASVHGRDNDGDMPIHSWCKRDDISSAQGIIRLLEAGADLDARTLGLGQTVVHLLCDRKLEQILHELSVAGWLQAVNLDATDQDGQTPSDILNRMLKATPCNDTARQMLQLLWTEKKHWREDIRPALIALLTSHEQLVPELAELVVSFVDQEPFTHK